MGWNCLTFDRLSRCQENWWYFGLFGWQGAQGTRRTGSDWPGFAATGLLKLRLFLWLVVTRGVIAATTRTYLVDTPTKTTAPRKSGRANGQNEVDGEQSNHEVAKR